MVWSVSDPERGVAAVCLTVLMQQVGEVRGVQCWLHNAPVFPSSRHRIAMSTTNTGTNTLALLVATALMFCLNSVRLHVFSSLKY